jgi:hypothetical protein
VGCTGHACRGFFIGEFCKKNLAKRTLYEVWFCGIIKSTDYMFGKSKNDNSAMGINTVGIERAQLSMLSDTKTKYMGGLWEQRMSF